jgi:hypothetical protein
MSEDEKWKTIEPRIAIKHRNGLFVSVESAFISEW